MPSPLTDELTDEAKAELSALFAQMRRRFGEFDAPLINRGNFQRRRRDPWELR